MSVEKKVRAAQLSVLGRYGVLADLSGLQEPQLDRALKGAVPLAGAQQMTYATWCNQLFGQGYRVPVARFDGEITGQTKFISLAQGQELARGFKARERQLQAQIKAAKEEAAKLREELAASRSAPVAQVCDTPACWFQSDLARWYTQVTQPVHNMLWRIKEIDVPIFDHRGALNRTYRGHLIEIILTAMQGLEDLGFFVDAELRDMSAKDPIPPVVLHRSRLSNADELPDNGFSFVVKKVQTAMVVTADAFIHEERTLPSEHARLRFDCHVSLRCNEPLANVVTQDDLHHLSCFLYKLFESMARSGDNRPRAAVREGLILCLLLSRTAPCVIRDSPGYELPPLQDLTHRGYGNRRRIEDPDVSAGKILQHLFTFMRRCDGY